MTEVTVTMPLALTPEMMRAVRDDPLCEVAGEQWHARLGWLICAWDVLVHHRRDPFSKPQGLGPLPEAVGHLHSDGEFCQDRAVDLPVWWPVSLYTEEQLRAAVAAERERCADALNMARICAENNHKRADDCGDLARKLLAALNGLRA